MDTIFSLYLSQLSCYDLDSGKNWPWGSRTALVYQAWSGRHPHALWRRYRNHVPLESSTYTLLLSGYGYIHTTLKTLKHHLILLFFSFCIEMLWRLTRFLQSVINRNKNLKVSLLDTRDNPSIFVLISVRIYKWFSNVFCNKTFDVGCII